MKAWLSDLPTTALVVATGCLLAFLTGLFFFGATIAARPIDDGNWNAWLMFVAAMLGVGYAQFAKKRDTNNPEMVAATAEASAKLIAATAAAVPPLTPKQAVEAGRAPDGEGAVVVVAPAPRVQPMPPLPDHVAMTKDD